MGLSVSGRKYLHGIMVATRWSGFDGVTKNIRINNQAELTALHVLHARQLA